eukprot:2462296-Prymnesium_polylepis.1
MGITKTSTPRLSVDPVAGGGAKTRSKFQRSTHGASVMKTAATTTTNLVASCKGDRPSQQTDAGITGRGAPVVCPHLQAKGQVVVRACSIRFVHRVLRECGRGNTAAADDHRGLQPIDHEVDHHAVSNERVDNQGAAGDVPIAREVDPIAFRVPERERGR